VSEPTTYETAASLYEQLAHELERAAQHARTAATHFRHHEPARGAAHAFAVHGHATRATAMLDSVAQLHADRSTP
jgi:hypothetical protein